MALKVVFVHWGDDISEATMMVNSCKRFGYEVWQLTDETSPEVPLVDRVERKAIDCPKMLYRMRRIAKLDAPYVMMDTDMLVAEDISSIEDGDHDVGLSWRQKGGIFVKEVGKALFMPWNGGLIHVRNRNFIRECADEMEKMPDIFKEWFGDQLALRAVGDRGEYKIRRLEENWNYSPNWLGDIEPGRKIYHFKGKRKRMMRPYYEEFAHKLYK